MLNRLQSCRILSISLVSALGVLSGCGPSPGNQASMSSMAAPSLAQVTKASYQPSTDTLLVSVKDHKSATTNESTIDLNSNESIYNYAASQVGDQPLKAIRVTENGRVVRTYNNVQSFVGDTAQGNTGAADNLGSAEASFVGGTSAPPGVRYDARVNALAKPGASVAAKERAILRIAESKIGTPYIWGHNEDRGQYGFDCSNYVEYVMHHALGYTFSGASMVQVRRVGYSVPVSQMRVGDIIFFENGKHEGIFVGNRRMINEGGGLGKVGYLSVGPGSYWGKRITSVRRLT